ncbi:uncharacterized protein LOC105767213 [Gossypium raimondii]|uniref:uncharacterized protein LOC105767213 n=1 Tax=Gossypium raimondii TaxID=29730 RepID=UPI00063ACB34|nr:uncharacterized protein LOC105767213 [Gossypium raimondii]
MSLRNIGRDVSSQPNGATFWKVQSYGLGFVEGAPVRKGCGVYSAYILDTNADESVMENILVVREFLNVFQKELPGLPLEHEVDFGIELLPGTIPVSITPYRMAPKDLRRFVKGFSSIRAPSTKLLRSSAPFKWTEEQQASFEKLWSMLTQAPVLVQPKSRKDYVVYNDASHNVLRWCIEFLKDCDCTIECLLGKTNIVVDSLSRRAITKLRAIFARLSFYEDKGLPAKLRVRQNLVGEKKSKQPLDSSLVPHVKQIEKGKTTDFGFNSDGVLCYYGRYCVPLDRDLKQSILRDAHSSPYAMHPGENTIWWTHLCWTKLGEKKVLGLDSVQGTESTVKLIHDRLRVSSDCQKSYSNLKRRDIEFYVGDRLFLKVLLWKKVMRFGRMEKLSLRIIGSCRILKRVRPEAYQLELPPKFENIDDVFCVSILRCYR